MKLLVTITEGYLYMLADSVLFQLFQCMGYLSCKYVAKTIQFFALTSACSLPNTFSGRTCIPCLMSSILFATKVGNHLGPTQTSKKTMTS